MSDVSRFAHLACAALLLSACAASGPTDSHPEVASASSAGTAESAVDEEQVICKEVRKTGTRFGTRTCLTASQWESIQRGSREGVDEIQRRASQQQDMPGQGG